MINIKAIILTLSTLLSSSIEAAALVESGSLPMANITFDPEAFLAGCQEDTELCSRFLDNRAEISAHHRAWTTLFRLRDWFSSNGNGELLAHTYHTMAKFVLSTDIPPLKTKSIEALQLSERNYRAQHISDLLDIFSKIIGSTIENNKVKKWSLIYNALLAREWANKHSSRRTNWLNQSFDQLNEAIRIKSTRTAYIVAADLILKDGLTPVSMNRDEALAVAREYLAKAARPGETSQNSPANNSSMRPFLIKAARPPYIFDILGRELVPNLSSTNNDEYEEEEEDELATYDFSALEIATRDNDDDLPTRLSFLNAVGHASRPISIEARNFRRQDVSAVDMNCFFNSMGLTRADEIARLRERKNDPVVRFMVANEIVSAAHNPEQLDAVTRIAIGFQEWQARDGEANGDRDLIEINDADLRSRALKLASFNAFLDLLATQGTMMGMLQDVQGNAYRNYTAIDAIAYVNRIGIKIYDVNGGLLHTFIPHNAIEMKYIVHHINHFQVLTPYDGTTDDDESEHEGISDDESNSDENHADSLESDNAVAALNQIIDSITARGLSLEEKVNDWAREYLRTDTMPSGLRLWLEDNYNHIKPDIGKKEEVARNRIADLPTLKLIHHYSRNLAGRNVFHHSLFDLFKKYLLSQPKTCSRLHTLCTLPKRIISDKILLYWQALAYREEIRSGAVAKNRLEQACNAEYNMRFSKSDFSFFKTRHKDLAPKDIEAIIAHYKRKGISFLRTICKENVQDVMSVLWENLDRDDLPAKEVGELDKKTYSSISDREANEFFSREFRDREKLDTRTAQEIVQRYQKRFAERIRADKVRDRFKRFKSGSTFELGGYHFSNDKNKIINEYFQEVLSKNRSANVADINARLMENGHSAIDSRTFTSRLERARESVKRNKPATVNNGSNKRQRRQR